MNEIYTLVKTAYPMFDEALLKKISEIGELRDLPEDFEMIRPGQYFKYTLLVLDGLVKVYREGDDGNEFFMYYITNGQACALSMICATRNQQSEILGKTDRPTKVLQIPIQYMDELMQQYRSWYYFVLENYRSRFEEMLDTIDNIAFKAMDERLEFYLKRYGDMQNSDVIEISHQQIATELNSSREVISRLLKKMEQHGKIKLGRNLIQLIK